MSATAVAEATRKPDAPKPAPARSTAPSRAARDRTATAPPRAEPVPPRGEEKVEVGGDAEPGRFADQLGWLRDSEQTANEQAASVARLDERYGHAAPPQRRSDQLTAAAQAHPPNLAQAQQLLHDAPPEEQRQLLQDLAKGDGRALMTALHAEGVTQEQRTAILGELSRLTASVGDPALTGQLGATLTGVLESLGDSKFTGQVADALKTNLKNGVDAGLGVEMVRAAGKEVATRLSDRMAEGFKDFYNKTRELGEKVASLNGDLAYLVQNFGPMMSEAELQKAIDEFKSGHPEFAQLEARGGAAVSNVEHVQQFEQLVGSKLDAQQAQECRSDINLTKASGAAALALPTQGAQAAVSDLLAREGRGENTWLTGLDRCASGDVTQGAGLFKQALFNAGVTGAATAVGNGDPTKAKDILNGLAETGGLLGLEGANADRVVGNLNSILTAKDPASLDAALKALNDTIGVVGDALPDAAVGRLKAAGAGLGIAGVGLSGYQLADHPSLRNLASFLADGTEFAAQGIPKIEAMLARAFGQAGPGAVSKVAGGVGVLLSVWDAGQAFGRGDVNSGLLSMGSALGSALVAAGSTGVGLLIGGAALVGSVALDAYRRTQAANHFESGDTKDFLRHALADAGLTEDQMDQAVSKLCNAGGDGMLNGILIQQAAAQVGLSPGELLNRLSRLPSGKLEEIMERGHKVDPEDRTDLTSLDAREVAVWIAYLRQQGLVLPC